MKNLSKIVAFVLISQIAFSQITKVSDGTVAYVISLPSYGDAGTTAYEVNPPGSGYFRYVRISNRWVNIYIDSGQTYFNGMSTALFYENTLPCNFTLRSGQINSNGSYLWTPSSTLPTFISTTTTYGDSYIGSCSFPPNQNISLNPTNLQLPILPITPLPSDQNLSGQLSFTGPNGNLNYNNGAGWKSVWPNNDTDYLIQNWQKIKFGSNGYIKNYITSTYPGFNSNTGVALGFSSDKLIITNEGVDLKSSLRTPIRTTSVSTTLDLNDHVLVVSGISTGLVITIPSANSGANKGLVYKILNHSASSISLSQTVITGWGSTGTTLNSLNSNTNITIIADGMWWRKVAD